VQIYNKKVHSESYAALNLFSINYFLPAVAFIVFETYYNSISTFIGFKANNCRSKDFT
jgi:hypothetical protein